MLNHVQLYYFSPTGGTKACAEAFCNALSRNTADVNLGVQGVTAEPDRELAVFALPVYGGRIPAFAAEKISTLKGAGRKAVTLAVYGTRAYEDALLELNNAVTAAGFQVVASGAVVARHSIVPAVGEGRPDGQDAREIAAFAEKVLKKLEIGEISPVAVPGNFPYKDGMNLPVTPVCLPGCTGCGRCASVCPTGAMTMEAGIAKTDPDKCILCLACAAVCPAGLRRLPAPVQESMNEKLAAFLSLRRENAFFL